MAQQNFQMYAGDTKTLRVTVRDKDDDAVSIASATIKWECARSFGKASIISKTTSSGITISDAAGGEFEVLIDASDTEDLSGVYYHEAEVTFSDGSISTVLAGTMTVQRVLIEAT